MAEYPSLSLRSGDLLCVNCLIAVKKHCSEAASEDINVINTINGTSHFHIKTNIYDKLEQNRKTRVTTLAHLTWNDPILCTVTTSIA